MSARFGHPVLVLLVILGLLMPRISAAVAMVTPGLQTIVICAGDGLRTITIDPDGKPVPASVSAHPDHCVLSHTADTAVRIGLQAVAAQVITVVPRVGSALVTVPAYRAARPPPRAPPLV